MPKFPDEIYLEEDGKTATVPLDFTNSFCISFPVKQKGLNNPLVPASRLKVFGLISTESWTVVKEGLSYNQAVAEARKICEAEDDG